MPKLEEIVALCKRRGFVYPSSEIYGGLANAYDYGPLGVELLRKIKELWWKRFISQRADMVGLDSQIILHPKTWEASGHVTAFFDPLVEDKISHQRYRADHLLEAWLQKHPQTPAIVVEDLSLEEMQQLIKKFKIKSPQGNELTEPKKFDLLFETSLGIIAGQKSSAYLRGETAQGIFSNFKQITDSTRVKLPFGVGQIGKSFRNEITTGQFVFRTFEFEQAEIEYFFDPEQSNWQKLLKTWQQQMWDFVTKDLGVRAENLRWRRHTDKERSHYSQDTYDLEYHFSFGWKELWGVAYRTDYDLKQHQKFSGVNLNYKDPQTNREFIPHVIEPAVGINRLFLMILTDSYRQEPERISLKLPQALAPYQIAVFPLLANKPELVSKAKQIYTELQSDFTVYWDDRGNIGKRYRYQDEMGTPFCVTVDFDSLEDQAVTVRERDSMKQERIAISKLKSYFQKQP
ncbi:glycine--tRNA ligase [Candidatus Roizmanbacteria bacterium RIFOXYB2_FULL_41_10]|uniref:glycine--tRNA ligase n=1 Tax=Candidatus Roizmanbacteria bacterium RIFOXYA1_FULL_41_12 TaxID=1802082 RepID=A0A1F7KFL0_9BACT|nr:MAG: glycine--tRNA ligase [Candidatus Roizmanbacteria bacterium RIFOXYA1_FULL_41_12]OGK67641.1 MAG: glycine--tRNA ligase [Candidatus Roizmanbacteria bacterium RIFOXYB1_FULL_41_27]OGK67895.1 MAG: glycine--tRNA ligase [Candidatus Roizmanbacteria bacterium RIFOXYA2_FULL_41_8]OGK69350.1 MAG: glycine--tRNA ligase [Candidatus Roizmanbacteria bacterium RIFOXYB2_FULL_41_10]OGK71363.1 MAG: glycine--tRNA ligase [Candidatus Roizmanbacteria bacterium RIFOXYC1_FULL_41_16]OGK75095.1 MAG: glycine--tRNA li